MSEQSYESWGRLGGGAERRGRTADEHLPSGGSFLPFGNGRSYGDSCHNDAGQLLDSRPGSKILHFDPQGGVLSATAGVLLADITRHVASSGWFLPVTPGTQFVTLGGAVANDVHGKNHHRRGTFGRWVRSLDLVRSDLGRLRCSPIENPELFAATVGGMGLTGLIRSVDLQLLHVASLSIAETTTRFDGLGEYFELAEAADARHEYAVAWIDSLATGRRLGRGHLITGDHLAGGSKDGAARPPLLTVPFAPPVSPLSGLSLKTFNEFYFRKACRGESRRSVSFDRFFYPLDRVGGWNRLYGPQGLHQHQSVVPLRDAESVVRALLECAAAHRQGSFLTVLKRFGDVPSPGILSFPRAGYTLTLDFPHRRERTLRLLADLDRIATEAGGAVNPYKDARMSPQTFAASFPDWWKLEERRDPAMLSDFWRRTALKLPRPAAAELPLAAE